MHNEALEILAQRPAEQDVVKDEFWGAVTDLMKISDIPEREQIGTQYIIINSSDEAQIINIKNAGDLRLHPIQTNGHDRRVRQSEILIDAVRVPPLTTAIFIRREKG